MKQFKRSYSGKKRSKFWDRIDALPDRQHDTAYSLGVALQNVECDLLRLIEIEFQDAEMAADPRPEV